MMSTRAESKAMRKRDHDGRRAIGSPLGLALRLTDGRDRYPPLRNGIGRQIEMASCRMPPVDGAFGGYSSYSMSTRHYDWSESCQVFALFNIPLLRQSLNTKATFYPRQTPDRRLYLFSLTSSHAFAFVFCCCVMQLLSFRLIEVDISYSVAYPLEHLELGGLSEAEILTLRYF